MTQVEKKARLSELDLAHLESSQWARYSAGRNEYAPTEPARAAAEIRILRTRITELEALVAEAREENERLKAALRPFAKIEVPRTAEAGTWVARTLHCNDQVTAHSVWNAREALGRHKDSQHEL